MKIVAKNRRANFDYQIVDTIEAGIILSGQEVKSCRLGHVNLAGAYVSFFKGTPVLKQASIAVYPFASGTESYEPNQDRQLLLSKKDIERLNASSAEKGTTLIPMEVRAGKYIKVLIGVGKGRKRIDKRQKKKDEDIKKRLKKGIEY